MKKKLEKEVLKNRHIVEDMDSKIKGIREEGIAREEFEKMVGKKDREIMEVKEEYEKKLRRIRE